MTMCVRGLKSQDPKKAIPSPSNASTEKQSRKGANPCRFPQSLEQSLDMGSSASWICKNSACRAFLPGEDSFCSRCSCCICHHFDCNKDPSLWLVCDCESSGNDACSSSCHVECAIQHEKVGVVNLGQYMPLDGNYCCPSCGKVSGILRFLKKQLEIAIEARHVDALCYRLLLAYRLLDGTSRFNELFEVVKEAKDRLEAEVGPQNGAHDMKARGIVSRLTNGTNLQNLCFKAIEKCEQWLAVASNAGQNDRVDSLPAACRFFFQEITSSSLFLFLVVIPTLLGEGVKGFKLWYCKSRTGTYAKDPICTLPGEQTKVLISDLEPCTEYSFRVVCYTENGDSGQSEAKCFTRSKEVLGGLAILHRSSQPGFEVQDDLGNMLHLAWEQQRRSCSTAAVKCSTVSQSKGQASEDNQSRPTSRVLDLNVPDLNEDIMPPIDSSRDEEDNAVGQDDDAASLGNNEKKSHGSDSQTCNRVSSGDVRDDDSEALNIRKRAISAIEEPHDCNSALLNGSSVGPSGHSGSLDENFESGVKTIRWLECLGYITSQFRLKFLTWFSLGSTEQERRVVNTFIQTLLDDPGSLAAQLVDSFDDIIQCKRQKNGML